MARKNQTYRRVLYALFTAIIIIQNFVPFLGYIPVGPLNLTIIHVTVIIAALTLGPGGGAVVGGIWGVITFVRAFVWPTSPLAAIVFVNPLVSVLPRILIGVVAGYVFKWLADKFRQRYLAMGIAAVLGSLTNTILVLGQIYFFYNGHSQALYQVDVHALLPYLLGVVGANGVPEAIFAGLAAPLIAKPLLNRGYKG
ncbi:membrane protein [Ligilactobacillus salitolerans]|uniref:Membrane protein n=1 Tax=Ligilactobacillus salitolerans TaxID=1808352 RepID=A0A401IT84_9LACO|nr:ECF transporter S component [Ligilactobacillus salitolerans]GBG94729.1 membrane protein [Ligilactobacillus salitolerans]